MVAPESHLSPEDEALSMPRAEVRQRSLTGIFFLTCSSFINLVVGFVASLVLARLLTPADFGVVAVGLTAMLLGARLRRRRPRRGDGPAPGAADSCRAAHAERHSAHSRARRVPPGRRNRPRLRPDGGRNRADGPLAPDHGAAGARAHHPHPYDAVRPAGRRRGRFAGDRAGVDGRGRRARRRRLGTGGRGRVPRRSSRRC